VQFLPRRLGVVKKNKLLTSAAKRYRQQYDAEGDESDAFRDLLVCGISWTENRLDDEDNPEGDPLGCNPQETDPFNSRGEQEDRKPSNINAGSPFKPCPAEWPSETDDTWRTQLLNPYQSHSMASSEGWH